MRNIRLLIPQPHGPNKPLILNRSPRKVLTNKSRFGDDSLPALFCGLLPGFDDFEHFFFGYAADFGDGNTEFGSFFGTLLLDGCGKGFGGGRLCTVEEVGGEGCGGGLGGARRFDVLLFVLLNLLA